MKKEKGIQKLKDSIQGLSMMSSHRLPEEMIHGQIQPIVVVKNDNETYTVYVGHSRTETMRELRCPYIRAVEFLLEKGESEAAIITGSNTVINPLKSDETTRSILQMRDIEQMKFRDIDKRIGRKDSEKLYMCFKWKQKYPAFKMLSPYVLSKIFALKTKAMQKQLSQVAVRDIYNQRLWKHQKASNKLSKVVTVINRNPKAIKQLVDGRINIEEFYQKCVLSN